MIGRIQGRLVEKSPTLLLVDVGGVGYELEIPLSTFYQVGDVEENITLHTQLVVREDAQLLYGFFSRVERQLFRSLVKVNGVGPRLAVTILSGIEAAEFGRCIRDEDVKSLVALPGVGKKTAQQLIISMRDRLPDLGEGVVAQHPVQAADNLADAEAALIGLGYKPQETARALAHLKDSEASVEVLIKQALKGLS